MEVSDLLAPYGKSFFYFRLYPKLVKILVIYFHSIFRLGLTANHGNGGSKVTKSKEDWGLSTIIKKFEEGDGNKHIGVDRKG